MPNALQLCPNDHPPFGEVCAGHAEALARLGFRVRTVFFESRGFQPPAGFEFEYRPADRLGDLARPEVLVSHRYGAYRVGVPLARRQSISQHVVVAHEFGMFARLSRRIRRRLWATRTTRFAGVSAPVAEDLRDAGVRSPVVLPNPIDAARIRAGLKARGAARAALGVPDDAFVVGVIGRLHPKKDPMRALDVFARYRAEDHTAHLVFIGTGPLQDRVAREAGDGVVLAGFRSDARELLGAYDAILSCSTRSEAFGLALLEALAAGTPVIAADQPGPRFVLGQCGSYFQTDAELLARLRDARARRWPPRHADYVETATQRVTREFSEDALAFRYRALGVGGWDR